MQNNLERFKEQLCSQLGFIDRSCTAFDAGHEDEAVRIATTIRVLLHDTKRQTSLLKHMQAKDIHLLTTASTKPLPVGVYLLEFSDRGFWPKLGNGSTKEFVPVEKWWTQIVLIDKGIPYSRQTVVLSAAENDGGAHVDKMLTPEYEPQARHLFSKSIG